jgi:hypothetical protein
LTIEPIRMTLAGSVTDSVTGSVTGAEGMMLALLLTSDVLIQVHIFTQI